MKKTTILYLGPLALIVVLCGVVIAVATLNTTRQARAFLLELKGIQLGPGGYNDVRALATRFRHYVKDGSNECTQNECSLTLMFENTWLRKLHLATPTNFGSILLVRNGSLYYINAAMTLYSGERVISANTDLTENGHQSSSYSIDTKRWDDNQPWQAIIHLTPEATTAQREAAFSFNLACLSKLVGCRDSSDLLPPAWHDDQSKARNQNKVQFVTRLSQASQ